MVKDGIVNKIKENIATHTDIFDIETISTQCTAHKNKIQFENLNGEWVITRNDGDSCINRFVNIIDSEFVAQDCFYGAEPTQMDIVAHNVNVGSAIKRDIALQLITGGEADEEDNLIVIYWKSTTNTINRYNSSMAQDNREKLKIEFGIMFRIPLVELEALGSCDVMDKVVINSIIKIDGYKDISLIKFDGVKDRFFAGKYYCVDLSFSYVEDISLNDIIAERVRHFNADLECNTIKKV